MSIENEDREDIVIIFTEPSRQVMSILSCVHKSDILLKCTGWSKKVYELI